ncbi:MAG: acyl-CoA thioesterase [Parachlamydiaceae bacterium]
MYMVFTAKNQVRMHDTDAAGILFFAQQFRFVNDALEDYLESQNVTFDQMFHNEKVVMVIVHCESDYYKSLYIGNKLEIDVSCERIGNSAFTLLYQIYRIKKEERELVGIARTVHCAVDVRTRSKVPIPEKVKKMLESALIR